MTDVTTLSIAVDSRQVRTAAADLDRLSSAGGRTERSLGGLASGLGRLAGTLAGLGVVIVARQTLAAADAFNNLNARLKLVTRSTEEFQAAQRTLLGIAQSTATGLQQTVDLYGSLARSTQALGVSQKAVLEVTKTINQAIAVSGTSAQGASAALVQLGQAFSSGVLRGEELNSVLEQAPRLAQAIAEGLGVTVGELRRLGQEGRLTASQVFQALRQSGAAIDAEFRSLPLTIGRATQQTQNSIAQLIGTIDQLTGTSPAIARWIGGFSVGLDQLALQLKLARTEGRSTAAELFRFFSPNLLGGGLETVDTRVAALTERMIELRSLLDTPRRLTLFSGEAAKLEEERRQLEKTLATLERLRNPGRDGIANRMGQNFTAEEERELIAAEEARIKAARAAEGYIDALRRQLEATQSLSAVEQLEADVSAKRFKVQSAGQLARARQIAAEIDASKQRQDQLDAEAQQLADLVAGRKALADEGRRVFESVRTPAERLNAELQRASYLLDQGAIGWETYGRVATRSLSESLKELKRTSQGIPRLVPPLKEAKAEASSLGLTFSSAFEDAIVGGRKLSDVLKTIYQDLLRIVIRRAIVQPVDTYISSLFANGALSGGRAIGGPVSAGGAYRVLEKGQPELLQVGDKSVLMMGSQSGHVTPAATGPVFNYAPTITANGDVSPQTLAAIRAEIDRDRSRWMRQLQIRGAA